MAKKIMLDAGHFGNYYNKGAVAGYYESNMTWDLHKYLKAELESYGFEVGVTREDKQKDLEVSQRGLKSKGYDLFLSLHSNAASAESPDYVALYHLVADRTTDADEKSKLIANKLAPVIARIMGTKQKHQVLTRPVNFDRDGDGQLNDNYYGVLHGADVANTPGIIIEHSFHTNVAACKWLMSADNLKALAKAEAEVIAECYGYKKKNVTPDPVPEEKKEICEGDLVKVSPGAVWMTGKAVPSFVINDKWYVKSVNGSRVVIDKNEAGSNSVMSPIDSKYLTVVENGGKIEKGDKVKLDKGAVVYGTNRKFASFVYDSTLYVREITGARVVISTLQSGAVTGAVDIKYLNKI